MLAELLVAFKRPTAVLIARWARSVQEKEKEKEIFELLSSDEPLSPNIVLITYREIIPSSLGPIGSFFLELRPFTTMTSGPRSLCFHNVCGYRSKSAITSENERGPSLPHGIMMHRGSLPELHTGQR